MTLFTEILRRNLMEKRLLKFAFAVAACLLFAGSVNACVTTIGAAPCAIDVDLSGGPTGPTLATVSSTLSATTFTASYTESVLQNGTDPLGACPACLDFVLTLTNSAASTDAMGRITTTNFLGASITTDVAELVPTTGVAPITVERDAAGTGSLIAFNYSQPGNLPKGSSTPELIIFTNALTFSNGTLNGIDGSVASGPAFAPATVPEPSLGGLLFLGSAGLMAFARRFKKSALKS
jgi:hypothetical protein